jgi:uncharacterized protein YndB with AHSA1/START domain
MAAGFRGPRLEGLTEVTFYDVDGKTRMTMRIRAAAVVVDAAPHIAGMEAGWTQSIGRLHALLPRGL